MDLVKGVGSGILAAFLITSASGLSQNLHPATHSEAPTQVNPATTLPGAWALTGSLNTARYYHTATLLNDGTILVVGGEDSNGNALASAEIYNPATGKFTFTKGQMTTPRAQHGAVLLPNGKVLILGGSDLMADFNAQYSAEIYNPATQTFTATGKLNTQRVANFTMTMLANGKVLVTGGSAYGATKSSEIYDPVAGTFATTGDMIVPRVDHSALLLENGEVLIAGGSGSWGYGSGSGSLNQAEIYNPVTGTFTEIPSMSAFRVNATLTLLNGGSALALGGGFNGSLSAVNAEVYNPVTQSFVVSGAISQDHSLQNATLMTNGTVLIAGGASDQGGVISSASVYNPSTGTFTDTASMSTGRAYWTQTLLPDGKVIAIGGTNGNAASALAYQALSSAEIYTPASKTLPGLSAIAVTPAAATVGVGQWQTFSAEGTFAAGKQSLHSVIWRSTAAAMASVGNDGSFSGSAVGVAPGSATIAATNGTVSGKTTVTVVPARTIKSVSVTPNPATIAVGTALNLKATVDYSDGSSADVTQSAQWSSSNPAIAAVGFTGQAAGIAAGGPATITATFQGVNGTTKITVTAGATLNSISITPNNAILPIVNPAPDLQFAATGTYSNGFKVDLTKAVVWKSTSTTIATIVPGGLATCGSTAGSTTITAALGAVTGSAVLAVSKTPLQVFAIAPAFDSIDTGTTAQIRVNDQVSGGITTIEPDQIGWYSSNPAVATVNPLGLVTGVSPGGPVSISAVWQGFEARTTLYVTTAVNGGVFVPTGNLNDARAYATATMLNNGKVLLAGGYGPLSGPMASAEIYDPGTGKFTVTGGMNVARWVHSAALLPDGEVLITGGQNAELNTLASAEIYDPATGQFRVIPDMLCPRSYHTSTVLRNGMVLIAGSARTAEFYNPVTGKFQPAGRMVAVRQHATTTMLNNGTVLFAGGNTNTAEIYDPSTGEFTATGPMSVPRAGHTATLLNDGTVLIAAGVNPLYGDVSLQTAEIYHPSTGTFSLTGSLLEALTEHTATLLTDGSVLIAGGLSSLAGGETTVTEIYNPATHAFLPGLAMIAARHAQTATLLENGKLLVVGGEGIAKPGYLKAAELYTPGSLAPPSLVSISVSPTTASVIPGANQTFVATGTFSNQTHETLASVIWSTSSAAVATISNDVSDKGKALGVAAGGPITVTASSGGTHGSAQLTVNASALESITVTPSADALITGNTTLLTATGSFKNGSTQNLTSAVEWSTTNAAVASVKNGVVSALKTGGPVTITATLGTFHGEAQITVAATGGFLPLPPVPTAGEFGNATLLTNGDVLLATGNPDGGAVNGISPFKYDPGTDEWQNVSGGFAYPQSSAVAAMLPTGYVFYTGGYIEYQTPLPQRQVYLYYPSYPSLTGDALFANGIMNIARAQHTATPLPDGTVLLAGGVTSGSAITNTAELASFQYYNDSGREEVFITETNTGNLNVARNGQTATMLRTGEVLVAGGMGTSGNPLNSAELYNPATGKWALTGSMTSARAGHTATLLNNGEVLIAGGSGTNDAQATAELYNPATGKFTLTGAMTVARANHTATLLTNGTVLIAGGSNELNPIDASFLSLADVELYNPATGKFTETGKLNEARSGHSATLMLDGMVLIAGGAAGQGETSVGLTSAEFYIPTTLTPPGLVSISITPANPSIAAGTTQAFVATGKFSNNTTQILGAVAWTSSDTNTAIVGSDSTNPGNALAQASGTATITASVGAISASTKLTVK